MQRSSIRAEALSTSWCRHPTFRQAPSTACFKPTLHNKWSLSTFTMSRHWSRVWITLAGSRSATFFHPKPGRERDRASNCARSDGRPHPMGESKGEVDSWGSKKFEAAHASTNASGLWPQKSAYGKKRMRWCPNLATPTIGQQNSPDLKLRHRALLKPTFACIFKTLAAKNSTHRYLKLDDHNEVESIT